MKRETKKHLYYSEIKKRKQLLLKIEVKIKTNKTILFQKISKDLI